VSSVPPATPSKEIADLAISTPPPTPPANLLPLHVRIRALLRSTCNNSEIQVSGREAERTTIFDFLTPFIDGTSISRDKIHSSMFISGAPGTGKTALVNAMIRRLSVDHPEVRVIAINCMALKDSDALWERMIEEFRDASNKRSLGKKSKGRDVVKSMLNALNVKWYVAPSLCILL
jgi:cell division control protein 6